MMTQLGMDSVFCVRLTETLLHSLWQGSAIAALAVGLGALLRRWPARVRCGTFVFALVLMAACPLITFLWLGETKSGPPATVQVQSQGIAPVGPAPATTWTLPEAGILAQPQFQMVGRHFLLSLQNHAPDFVSLYLLGVLLMISRLLFAMRGGTRLRQSSRIIDRPELLTTLNRAAKAIGLGYKPALAYCERVGVPTVVGILRPAILLPLSLSSGMSIAQVELLLMHELAHLCRHDHWVNLMQRVIESFFFYHPAVWLISRRIRTERELSCDDMVLAAGVSGGAYADSLLRMAEMSHRAATLERLPATALAAAERGSDLKERICRLIGIQSAETVRIGRSWPAALCLGLLLMASLFSLLNAQAKDAAGNEGAIIENAKAEMMGRVEGFFLHNYRDITARKSLEWGDVETDPHGNRSIRYKFNATIWDKDVLVMNKVFTFDAKGKFSGVKDVEGYPRKNAPRVVDLNTPEGLKKLVEEFFENNFRDVTARKTVEWGEPVKEKDGKTSIRYKYEATIWDKDKKILNQVFTFDPKGKFVSVKNATDQAAPGH